MSGACSTIIPAWSSSGGHCDLQINWTPKPENIAAMASELNIGLDSIGLKDNPLERDPMRHALPEVITADVPVDPWYWCDTPIPTA